LILPDEHKPADIHATIAWFTHGHTHPLSQHMKERTTVRLPQGLLSRARRKAAAEGRTLASLIADGLRMAVADDRKSARAKRAFPPVSKSAGGLLPGIDVTNARSLQGTEDVDYMRCLTRYQSTLVDGQAPFSPRQPPRARG
jgi:hypothetical protein